MALYPQSNMLGFPLGWGRTALDFHLLNRIEKHYGFAACTQ